jgi:hypothetical protein
MSLLLLKRYLTPFIWPLKRYLTPFIWPPPVGGFKVKKFCIWGANYFITFCTKTETKINVVIVIEKVPDPIYLALTPFIWLK